MGNNSLREYACSVWDREPFQHAAIDLIIRHHEVNSAYCFNQIVWLLQIPDCWVARLMRRLLDSIAFGKQRKMLPESCRLVARHVAWYWNGHCCEEAVRGVWVISPAYQIYQYLLPVGTITFSCGDAWQIWTWLKGSDNCIYEIGIIASREINRRDFGTSTSVLYSGVRLPDPRIVYNNTLDVYVTAMTCFKTFNIIQNMHNFSTSSRCYKGCEDIAYWIPCADHTPICLISYLWHQSW